ncbi:hypothetical protein [Microbacterium oleivorans]|uniref:hypothetical protein n=1 Tax=Microbacterium oleivorans TaxID=273677 RepID=UPI00203A3D3A|nr:hypothetical protein [Microbacterium oleivorans]MCM3696829.1 hypothetical protein [Microbacterium oleivorans]
MRTSLPLATAFAAAAALAALLPHAAAVSTPGAVTEPAPDTVVAVTGDAANGFEISYYDGSADFPPTDSEALAECGEYDTRIERVRCRTEVRTWYRDLAVLRDALDWANAPRG